MGITFPILQSDQCKNTCNLSIEFITSFVISYNYVNIFIGFKPIKKWSLLKNWVHPICHYVLEGP